MTTVAALYVDSAGIYPQLLGAEACWGIERDARLYAGPYSVVAHPPCQRWTNLACLNFARYGGDHNRPGNDGGCFEAALRTVRQYGGVLEHPACSRAFEVFRLPHPSSTGWSGGPLEWVCEVDQAAYGHKARKRTWLFYVGGDAPAEARWGKYSGTHQVGFFDRVKPVLSKKEAAATPLDFAVFLISLAQNARNPDHVQRAPDVGLSGPA